MNTTLQMVIAGLMSLVAVHWIFMKILQIAKVKQLVDNPDARKLQKVPVPVLGGLAVYFGLIAGMMAFVAMSGMDIVHHLSVALGCSVMLYIGALDDILGLTPRSRLVIEVLVILGVIYGSGMCVDSLHGLWGVQEMSWWVAVPLTVFAGVGLINAYNMVDGVNGLSSGLCIAGCCILGAICWKRGGYADCALALCFAASLMPFLLHNVFGNRSKMFIGDAGTMMMGLLVTWFLIQVLSSENTAWLDSQVSGGKCIGQVAMMLAIASVPVADTLRVMTARVMRGESPFHPDKTHLHHVFIRVGVSHSITALSEILINLVIVAIWYGSYRIGASVDVQLYVVIAAAIVLIWGTYFYLSRVDRLYPDSWVMKVARKTHIGHKKWWLSLQKWLDRGAYEDYMMVMKQKLNKNVEDMTEKEKDTACIVNFLQGKRCVMVKDVMEHCCADNLRIFPILFELEQEGVIEVVERESLGAAKKIRFKA